VLDKPEALGLVKDTMRELFANGTFRNQIQAKTKEFVSQEIATPESRRLISDAINRVLSLRLAPRVLSAAQAKKISSALDSSPDGKVFIQTGALPEQQGYARKISDAISAAPLWKERVKYAEAGSFAAMTNDRAILLAGIVVVVPDAAHPPAAARLLEGALKGAGVEGVRIGTCECDFPPKAPDIWLYVGEKNY
jgi:hypothetical protein